MTINGGTLTAATRQIPVAEIAALTDGTKDVVAEGCEPGFTTRSTARPHCRSAAVSARPDETAYWAEPCGTDGKVVFPAVAKPSDAPGFFTIGVSATKGE